MSDRSQAAAAMVPAPSVGTPRVGGFIQFRKEEIEQSVPDRFEPQADRHAHRLAVRSGGCEFTYAALNETANRIAHAILARRGEGEETVALLFDQGAPVIAAILGVLKAGRIYVPLEPTSPHARTDFILNDSGARLLLTDTSNLPMARELAQDHLALIRMDEIDSATDVTNPGLTLSPDTLACLLYTSGSTGQPKGVLHDHRHLLDEARLPTNNFGIGPEDRLSLTHSCSFSASLRRLFPALLNGAALFPFDLKRYGARALPGWLIREEITLTSGRHLLRDCADVLTGPGQFPHIRLVSFGGDTIYPADVERYRKYLPDLCRMTVNLASTEAGTITRLLLDKETEIASRTIPVGCPVDGKTVLLLDEDGEPVGAGEIGEIAVQGCTLFRGYWGRPDLTAAALQPAPDGSGERIFRTGDLGQMAADGCLMHRGRKDFQVKVRGYRIEVAEVETALRDLDSVREAIVTARKNDLGDSRLVAYIVPESGVSAFNRDGQDRQDGAGRPVPTGNPVHPVDPCLNTGMPVRPITVTALRRSLAPALPEYMIPSAFVLLDELPRTATGKVDRKALPPPGRERPALEVPYAPPRTPIEETLVEIWAGILELDTVGIYDSFFELGGHSLLATRALARLRERLAVELPLRTLFDLPTIAAMAAFVAGHLADQTPPEQIDDLLTELAQLTEAEAQSRLTAESA